MPRCPTCGQEVDDLVLVRVRFEDIPIFEQAVDLFYEDAELKNYDIDTEDGRSLLISREAMRILKKKGGMKFSVDGEPPDITEEQLD